MTVATLAGPGVRLRGLELRDVDDLVAGYADPVLQRFMPPLPVPFTRSQAREYIRDVAPGLFADGGGLWAITDPVTDRLLGGIGLDKVVPHRSQCEVGYWVGPWARGRGVAVAALRALTEHAFHTGMARIELLTHRENAASPRVARAAGFQPEGGRRAALPNRAGGRDDLVA